MFNFIALVCFEWMKHAALPFVSFAQTKNNNEILKEKLIITFSAVISKWNCAQFSYHQLGAKKEAMTLTSTSTSTNAKQHIVIILVFAYNYNVLAWNIYIFIVGVETWLNGIVLTHLTQANYSILYGKVRKICVLNYRLSRAIEESGEEKKTVVAAVLSLTNKPVVKTIFEVIDSGREYFVFVKRQNNQSLKDWMDKWMHKHSHILNNLYTHQNNFNRHFSITVSLLLDVIGKITVKP